MTDAEIIAELVRCKRSCTDRRVCALEALHHNRKTHEPTLTETAFNHLGISVDTAWGIMTGFDNVEYASRRDGRDQAQFDRGVAIGRAVREQCEAAS